LNGNWDLPITGCHLSGLRIVYVSKKKAGDEADWETAERSKRRCIWVTGRSGLTEYEAAEMIIHEAKTLLAGDLMLMGVDWKPADNPGM